jgi:ABC-type polysaccharide/polyol phosphate transport system ATPase subunit
MKTPSVVVENLHFVYQIRNASAHSLKQAFINSVKGIKSDIHVSAINGINFELSSGDVLGIVGNNGAGKSTLLKLLAGIIPPSSGAVRVNGRVAPLIELGAGFNPELTGAENIVLFGVLLGNTRKVMEENVMIIAEWAGLTESINLPIRTYSTGMQSRLGFAVATFQENELLIIDEVLSVGDVEFQKKSMMRMDELISAGEVTILVSHDLNLVEAKSTKVLWLDRGKQVMFGNPKEVIDAYRKL